MGERQFKGMERRPTLRATPQMLTTSMTGQQVLRAAEEARAKRPAQEPILSTQRKPLGLSRSQLRRDSEVAKELIYIADVLNSADMLMASFYEYRHTLSAQRYWQFLKVVWVRTENLANLPAFKELFASKRPFKFWLMSDEEAARLNAMPENFTVWRAPLPAGVPAISWCANKEYIDKAAAERGFQPIERNVWKSHVTALFLRNGEPEVIIL